MNRVLRIVIPAIAGLSLLTACDPRDVTRAVYGYDRCRNGFITVYGVCKPNGKAPLPIEIVRHPLP